MSYGVRVGAHIGVDIVVKSLGPRAARAVGSLAAALCIVYALIVTWGGYQYVTKMHEVGILMQDMPVQQWIPRLVIPLGFYAGISLGSERPIVEIDPYFTWYEFSRPGSEFDNDKVNVEKFSAGLTAQLYLYL